MKRKILSFILGVIWSSSIFSMIIHEGQQYTKLNRPVDNAPQILEFFSFYCPHCYQFEEVYHIFSSIKKFLPDNIKIVRYHVDFLGQIGQQLTHAWAMAIVLGIEDKVNQLMFEALHRERSIKSVEDIRTVFLKSGVSSKEFDLFWNSCSVQNLILTQQQAASDFQLRGVPSIFINGKYMIKHDALDTSSIDIYIKQFIELIGLLIAQ
nr:thiol:disulfide interchange protein DsbA [Blochmannia endosymbiont of Camponotus (Colobopsis) obliquus]